VRSSLALFVRDLGLVADESRRGGITTGAAARLFSEAAAARGADHDDTELYDYVRARPDSSR
jgi:3-hydroxyisobutyrate dehydrogenase-like beta-hydroxyacid dehydrogenase